MTHPRVSKMARDQLELEVKNLRKRVAALTQHATRRDRREVIDGRPLARALLDLGWSQQALASAIPCDRQRVSNWCRGTVGIPRAFAEKVNEIFTGNGYAAPLDLALGCGGKRKEENTAVMLDSTTVKA